MKNGQVYEKYRNNEASRYFQNDTKLKNQTEINALRERKINLNNVFLLFLNCIGTEKKK